VLTTTGRSLRVLIAGALLALTLIGTVWGQDSAFPFGPFRMYSTRDEPNGRVRSTQIEGVTADGRRLVITGTETALRRAEVEGQMHRFRTHPELLATLAAAYQRRHHGARLKAVEIVVHDYGLDHSRAAKNDKRSVLARWERP
jgi:hypothetical protein